MEYNKLIECQGSAINFGAGLQTDGCYIIDGVNNDAFTSRSNKVEVTLVWRLRDKETLTGNFKESESVW